MRRTGLWWVTFAAVVIAGCSKTEGTKPVSDQAAPRPPAVGTGGAGADVKTDGDFVHSVALMNLAEIELSQMALDKATSPDIKSFAQRMVADHGVTGNSLKGAVSGHSIEWPAQLNEKHRKTADGLAAKQGADFDRDYVKAMVEGHQNLAALLESRLDVQSLADWKTAAAGRTQSKAMPEPAVEMRDVAVRPNKSDSEITMKINRWAAGTYPIVQKHLDTARTLANATENR
jgi:predicted outer membrane protein